MATLPHSQRTGACWADRAPAPRRSLWQQLRFAFCPPPAAVPVGPMSAHLPLRATVLCKPSLPPQWQPKAQEVPGE